MTKRLFDLAIMMACLPLLIPLLLLVALLVKSSSPGPAVYWTERIGRGNRHFMMPKFRSMRTGAPQLPTHLMTEASDWVTPVGRVLRRTSLDELPQVWSVLRGEMSLVGPRPALFNQDDLKALRTERGVHVLRPGVTGWAQVNGRDELPIPVKVAYDAEYLRRRSLGFDIRILALTVRKAFGGAGVSH